MWMPLSYKRFDSGQGVQKKLASNGGHIVRGKPINHSKEVLPLSHYYILYIIFRHVF